MIAFPDRMQPSHTTFSAVYLRVAEAGSVALQSIGRGNPWCSRTAEHEEHILVFVGDVAGSSTREIALACRTYHNTPFQLKFMYTYHF